MIHDITLRDGEEQVGIAYTYEDRIKIAESLANMGIPIIELGTLPAASKNDERAIKEIIKRNLGIKTFAMTYAGDTTGIKIALDCGLDGVMVGASSSEYLIRDFEQLSLEEAVDQIGKSTALAHENGLHTILFLIDAGRAEVKWLLDFIDRVDSQGEIDGLAIADSYGVLNPQGTGYLVRQIKKRFNKPVEIHCHNDFGLATANTLAALISGADVAHASVLGTGARAGNTPLEDLVVSLLTLYNKSIKIDYGKLFKTAELVSTLSGVRIPYNKPIVGNMLFKDDCERVGSFVRNFGTKKQLEGLFPYIPSLVGQPPVEVLLGKASGPDTIRIWLDKINRSANDTEVDLIVNEVILKAYDKKGVLSKEEFQNIVKKLLG